MQIVLIVVTVQMFLDGMKDPPLFYAYCVNFILNYENSVICSHFGVVNMHNNFFKVCEKCTIN